MRLIVARCEVTYSGRLSAVLPEAVRLLILKGDGSVLVHDDAGGFKPLNWMTAPTFIADEGDRLVVTKPKSEDALEIRLLEVLSDVEHDMGESAALQTEAQQWKEKAAGHLAELLQLREKSAILDEGLREMVALSQAQAARFDERNRAWDSERKELLARIENLKREPPSR